MPWFELIWDDSEDGNVEHMARHHVSPEEFRQVLDAADPAGFEPSRRDRRYLTTTGYTHSRRYLRIVWLPLDGITVYPITAFDED